MFVFVRCDDIHRLTAMWAADVKLPVLFRLMGFRCDQPVAVGFEQFQGEATAHSIDEAGSEKHRNLLDAVRCAIDQRIVSGQLYSENLSAPGVLYGERRLSSLSHIWSLPPP